MNSITTKSCAQCAYSAYEGDEVFTCRRFPPFGPPVMEDGEWHWYPVEVAPYHWCGEFKAETVSAKAHNQGPAASRVGAFFNPLRILSNRPR